MLSAFLDLVKSKAAEAEGIVTISDVIYKFKFKICVLKTYGLRTYTGTAWQGIWM